MIYFLIHENLPHEMARAISAYGTCVRLPMFAALSEPVCRHPDMLIARIGGVYLVHRDYTAGREILDSLGVPYRLSEAAVGREYPRDVGLNCFEACGCFFASERAVSPQALLAARAAGLRFVPVRQGYAKCATVVAGGAVASADVGICRVAEEQGIPALLLAAGGIGIETYDTGFIGGACGLIDDATLGFFGDVSTYGEYVRLRDFFAARGVRLVSLDDAPLFDYGGMVRIEV